ncbi:DUF4760 domain-containing protein [Acidovorax sp. CCYZU-2555]|uniref:DUF4760 domain-containing protein n=1 Tax=Acidovorax sp. CCYZU-2555 TaxID=2835042 RepID=UPI001BCE784E|nr:DUF4760 domain-containing protein [Acidovorax sp. CCYZU-2555]MBS7777684.1 DUF4760 domain-containing protein [Acidovorax sp. CCYZU-2555]
MSLSEKISIVQTVIYVVSAIAAVALLHRSRVDAKRNALTALLTQHRADARWQASTSAVYEYSKHGKSLDANALLDSPKELATILFLLDAHEQIAIQIYYRSIDEKLFKANAYSNYLSVWNTLRPLVVALRAKRGQPSLYEYYEFIAGEWKFDPPVKPNSLRWEC